MSRHVAQLREQSGSTEAPPRCLSCNGIFEGLSGQDLGIGLNLKLGLVSDECALICNACTAKLMEMRPAAAMPVTRRR